MNNITFTGNGKVVTIGTIDDEDVFTKKLTLLDIPTPTGDQSAGRKPTKVFDLLLANRRITINGVLSQSLGTSDTNSDQILKKADLLYMAEHGGVVSMTYEGGTLNVSFERISFKRTKGDNDGDTFLDGESQYACTIVVVVGENF